MFIRCICFLLFSSLLGFFGCSEKDGWEKRLSGPFPGVPYNGDFDGYTNQVFTLDSSRLLIIHKSSSTNHPILSLRESGQNKWSQVLLPQLINKAQPNGRIIDFSFTKALKTETGVKVYFSSYWTGGGNEMGIIYLNPDYSFKFFGISW